MSPKVLLDKNQTLLIPKGNLDKYKTMFYLQKTEIRHSWFTQWERWWDFWMLHCPLLSPHLSVAPTSCPGRARYCGLCYQPSAVVEAHPQRWAMTETAGPQGGPPPAAGRGPWSEALKEGGGGRGGVVVGGYMAVGLDIQTRSGI